MCVFFVVAKAMLSAQLHEFYSLEENYFYDLFKPGTPRSRVY